MKYKLALVEYLNTLPFAEGFRLHQVEQAIDIVKATPAECARLYEAGQVDISLCPIGALKDMPAYRLFGKYCIGADGAVGTVVLLSKVPLEKIQMVRYDDHSMTSNILLQILAQRFWKRDWEFYFQKTDALPEACLMIGDKVFENQSHYAYRYDLGEAWKEFTGLPMVFAVWIARPEVPGELLEEINQACETGLAWIAGSNGQLKDWQRNYLLHSISYPLDDAKKEAMRLYHEWAETTEAVPVLR